MAVSATRNRQQRIREIIDELVDGFIERGRADSWTTSPSRAR
jgi:hypothetical protein